MAARSKDDKISQQFKNRLDQLGCPFTEGVEESWITELLFKPGEPRIRLLQWLFSRFDPKLNELLDPHFAPANTKMDSRIQRLLFVASNLGLCTPDDADLIRGVTSLVKQTSFMTQLLDLVCIVDSAEDPQARAMISPGVISEGVDIVDQYHCDCDLIDKIATDTHMDQLFATQFKVLPPDIKKHLERSSENFDSTKTPHLPELDGILEAADGLAKEIQRQNDVLTELKQMSQYEAVDPQSSGKINKSLKLVLCELSQLVMGFSSCFETELRQWCNKEPPRLTELGPAFKRVHGLLEHFTKLLCGLGSIKKSHSQLCHQMREELALILHNKDKSLRRSTSSVEECVSILEESITRLENITLSSTLASQAVNITISTVKSDS